MGDLPENGRKAAAEGKRAARRSPETPTKLPAWSFPGWCDEKDTVETGSSPEVAGTRPTGRRNGRRRSALGFAWDSVQIAKKKKSWAGGFLKPVQCNQLRECSPAPLRLLTY